LACGEPTGISDNQYLWRTGSNFVNETEGDLRPADFDFTPDVSVFWKEHVLAHGLSASDVVALAPKRNIVFEALAESVREIVPVDIPMYVVYTPTPGDPPKCAHSSILLMGLKVKRDMSKSEWDKQDELRRLARDRLRDVFLFKERITPTVTVETTVTDKGAQD
jgi:hypothetical protein